MNKTITKQEARIFLLKKHGLYGEHRFFGRQGIIDYVEQSGCVQFDPIDVCGKNHELVFQSRVKNFNKEMLYSLLYEERKLMDWFDKNQCICLTKEWPYFEEARKRAKQYSRSKTEVDEVSEKVLKFIAEKGPVCSSDLEYNNKIDWYWSASTLSRIVLDTLYFRGDIVISHKKNTRKYYDLTERYISKEILSAKSPIGNEHEILKWRLLRRIKSVGMLHNNASYAFVGIRNLKSKQRIEAFEELICKKKLFEVSVEGIDKPFYIVKEDEQLFAESINNTEHKDRVELLAPLDNLLWDRKIAEEIFGFSYKWEIYTPIKDRKFGYYVLPVLYNDSFIARIELKRNKKQGKFDLLNIWYEEGIEKNKKTDDKIMKRLSQFQETMI